MFLDDQVQNKLNPGWVIQENMKCIISFRVKTIYENLNIEQINAVKKLSCFEIAAFFRHIAIWKSYFLSQLKLSYVALALENY